MANLTGKQKAELRIEERRVKVAQMRQSGKTQAQIAEVVGVSTMQVCRDLKDILAAWHEEYTENIDRAKAEEYQRALRMMSLCMDEYEKSRVRKVYPKGKDGKLDYTKKPIAEVEVQGDPQWMTQIRGWFEAICKIRGVYTETPANVTNNVNVFSVEKLAEEVRKVRDAHAQDRLAEVERMQAEMGKGNVPPLEEHPHQPSLDHDEHTTNGHG